MDLINLLIELASTPDHQNQLNSLLANQSGVIHHAFITHDAALLKQQLMLDNGDGFANERTVAQT
jgi:hypothetical protein